MNNNEWIKKGLLFVFVMGAILAPCTYFFIGSSPFDSSNDEEECSDQQSSGSEPIHRNMHPELQIAALFNQCDE